MRVFAAGLGNESNTFSGTPGGRRGFEENGVFRGDTRDANGEWDAVTMSRFRSLAEADGHQFVEGLLTFAQPCGPIIQSVYEAYRDEIVEAVAAQGPFDVILLLMHGAMVATGCDDCEGDLIDRVRGVAGPDAVIGVELDPHCHMTAQMVAGADAIVLMKEFPHDDYLPRANDLYAICVRAAAGEVRPTSALFDCRMVGVFPTTTSLMAGMLDRMYEAERRPGVLSVSLVHGFPWGDTPDTGAKVLAITDNDPALAHAVAAEIGSEFYALRDLLLPEVLGIDEALEEASRANGISVLSDGADNPGGGAPGDNTSILRAVIARRLPFVAIGPMFDPIVAQIAAAVGVGTTLSVRLGGKTSPTSDQPVDLFVTVMAVEPNHFQGGLGGARQPMGLSVWLRGDEELDIVVCSLRVQAFYPDLFSGLGIDLATKRQVVVKSINHFHTGFAPIADRIIRVGGTGALRMDFENIPYIKKRDHAYHPRLPDPIGVQAPEEIA